MENRSESRIVKYRNQHSLSFCYAGASFVCSCNGGIEKRMAGLCGSGDRFFYDRCTDADVKSNSHCGIM